MARVSRRAILAGAVSAPLISPMPNRCVDPLVTKASTWIDIHERREAMIRKWQAHETRLFAKVRKLRIEVDEAMSGNWPDAQAMRFLDERIDASFAQLADLAEDAWRTPATSFAGALAKFELGLAVQGPFDWRDHALELLQDGAGELRLFAAKQEFSDLRIGA